MTVPKKVLWSEGMLMSPQHLQRLDRFHQGMLAQRFERLDPFAWGVSAIEFDRRALSAGRAQLLKLDAVLPDGTLLSASEGDSSLPASRAIENHFPHTQPSLEIFLALRSERDNATNYGEGPGHAYRYKIERRSVVDESGIGQPAEVGFASPNAVLLFGNEVRDDLVTLKIGEVVRDDAGGLVICDPYIPPCTTIAASPFIVAGMRRVLAALAQRRQTLNESRRQGADASIEYNTSDVTRFLLLSSINRYLPVLQHLADTADVAPRVAYLALVELAGELCTFDANADASQLPQFLFHDLRTTFETLLARVVALLQATVREHHVSLQLTAQADGLHVAQITDQRLLRCREYLLAVRSKLPEQHVASQLPLFSKIASWADIQNILSAATPGAAVEVSYRPPPEIPVKAGTVYFTLRTDNIYWRNVVSSATLAVYLPQPFDPSHVSIELLAIPAR